MENPTEMMGSTKAHSESPEAPAYEPKIKAHSQTPEDSADKPKYQNNQQTDPKWKPLPNTRTTSRQTTINPLPNTRTTSRKPVTTGITIARANYVSTSVQVIMG